MILSPEECGCPLVEEGISSVNSPICSGTLLFMVLLEGFIRGRCDIATPCKNVKSEDHLRYSYDYIVVGGGSAGSIVAGRLSQDGKDEVLLIEAGGQEPTTARIPSFYRTFWSNEQLDWNYRTVPANYCLDQDGKGCLWPRGKVLGGCSVLNGMMYHRGRPADYDGWVEFGADGWSWEDNLPFFDMTEGNKEIGTLVSAQYHSRSGPLPVQRFNYQNPEVYTLLEAIKESGYPVVTDINDQTTPEGFAVAQAFNADGQRYTTARAYLKPKSVYPNLSVKLNTHVSRVIFEGNRAVGVEYIDKNNDRKIVRAKKEVILSAGALNSPHILLLSGIGPRATLEKFNIPVIADLPVGLNLRNHYGATLYFVFTKMKNTQILNWSNLVSYLMSKEGPMSSTGITQVTGFLSSSLAKNPDQPDIQFFFNGFYAECSKTGEIGEEVVHNCGQLGYNISANAAILLPESIGYLTLNSTDPLDPPIFDPKYFDQPNDMIMAKEGLLYLKRIYESPTFQELGIELDEESIKPCAVAGAAWSDDWLECMVRVHTDAQNHQQGTAAISAVVDNHLRVFNVSGLRVIDASVMPTQLTGNPQGAIMMVAERGAHFIKNENRVASLYDSILKKAKKA
ncbi:hypothetical protein O3G_MSEX002674 [Manduca sexta]|uniref:Glucose-methanol-choline oxidoreductase N-terminal domain-containing protein n=1 Tax=Manduca sexta TaxID=7130 RepID=A0A922CEH7_MANSE|nr:hypothetical protein O3G_MSEX002674 [Manduca sexta]KAG6443000.1 hypothetical protein O3G_MSEX002674 [Manduca sexta]